MMKIAKVIFMALITVVWFNFSIVCAESKNPTCILMKFTDDTRYDEVKSAEELSIRVFNELSKRRIFRLTETNPIDENIENLLYDEKVREYSILKQSMKSGNFDELFESAGFNDTKAQSIATAQVGQFISPEITSAIGEEHGAEYLIQGTIINLGVGNWWNDNYE